jgi:predicted patatin/cPLA2 family phospholipase
MHRRVQDMDRQRSKGDGKQRIFYLIIKYLRKVSKQVRTIVKMKPTTLVLGPGGIKGFLILGALDVLYKYDILENVKRYVGVSIGSVISLLLVCGYTVSEIFQIALDMPNLFEDFMMISQIKEFMKLLKDSVESGGLLSSDIIRDLIEEKVIDKYGFVMTLKQLYEATGDEYVSVALNVTTDTTMYFSYKTHPDMSCVEAAMLSINIPLIFKKKRYKNEIYFDGAFGDPYPINRYPNEEVLGLYIESICTDFDESAYTYMFKVATCSITQMNMRNRELAGDNVKNLKLSTMSKDTIGSTLNNQDKRDMYQRGYTLASEFVKVYGVTTVVRWGGV